MVIGFAAAVEDEWNGRRVSRLRSCRREADLPPLVSGRERALPIHSARVMVTRLMRRGLQRRREPVRTRASPALVARRGRGCSTVTRNRRPRQPCGVARRTGRGDEVVHLVDTGEITQVIAGEHLCSSSLR